jgi:predicted RND superfamily exporter protein
MSQNNDLLLEALAEKQAEMEKEMKQLKEKIEQPAKSYDPEPMVKTIDKVLRGFDSRIKKLELKPTTSDAGDLTGPKNRIWILPPWRHLVFMICGALTIGLLIRFAYLGYAYKEYYYKYKSIDLLGLTVEEADAFYEEVPRTFRQIVNDSLEVIDAKKKILEYEMEIKRIGED